MKLSFIYAIYHLSDNVKLRRKFSPTTYTNQEFWFHLCYVHSSCCYNSLNKIMCFILVNSTLSFLERILLQKILLVMHQKLIGRWCRTAIRGGRPPLPISENRKKCPDFGKKMALIVFIFGLNIPSKCSFKSI